MNTDRVRFTVEWLVPVSQARSITLALQAVANATRSDAGCLGCLVSTDFQHAGHVRYVEDWTSADELRLRAHARSFAPLARLIEDASRPPRIECTRANGDDIRLLTRELRDAARDYSERQLADDRAEFLHRRHKPSLRTRSIQTH
jgi:quinol monooxygenase YgiN